MSLNDFPGAFLETLREMFGDVDEAKIEHVQRLHRIWVAAQNDERLAAYRFIAQQIEGSNEKAELLRISWLLANGTYRGVPDVAIRPWWLENAEDWKSHVADRLEVRHVGTSMWMVYDRSDGEHVARVTREEGSYEVWHTPDDPAMFVEVRWHQTWTAAMQDVVAQQAMKQNLAHRAQPVPKMV